MDKLQENSAGLPDPEGLFDKGIEFFARGQIEEAVASLRRAFFSNIFIAPLLLGRTPEEISFPEMKGSSSLQSAVSYRNRKGKLWRSTPHALRFLKNLWEDPLVKREIQSYVNFMKSYGRSDLRSERVVGKLMEEQRKFSNERRIRSTQEEILERLRRKGFEGPSLKPRVLSLTLPVSDPEKVGAFFEKIFSTKIERGKGESQVKAGFPNLEIRFLPDPNSERESEITLHVEDLRYYLGRVEEGGGEVLVDESAAERHAFVVVRVPGGLILKLFEAEKKGSL